MSFGHAIGGPAVALVTVLLTLGAASLGLWQLVRGER
jgi:cytochrome oxidase assembly protein ShyY1